MKIFNNIILVSGSGRNCGKTTVACELISNVKEKNKVIGLKITPHFHNVDNSQLLITEGKGYKIYKENNFSSNKDTSRMLRAGASEVFFVQCNDDALMNMYDILKKTLPKNQLIICESGSFATAFIPRFHVLVEGANVDKSKKSYISNLKKASTIIKFNDIERDKIIKNITYAINLNSTKD